MLGKTTTVLLADDHYLIRSGFASFLGTQSGYKVYETDNVDDAYNLYKSVVPNLVIMDIRFGKTETGLDAINNILGYDPKANILVMTQYDEDSIIQASYKFGAKGFINKNSDEETLLDAMNEVADGNMYVHPDIAKRLALLSLQESKSTDFLSQFNDRELEVFKLIALGKTVDDIAIHLHVSAKTANVTSVAVKNILGTTRPADIARLAIKHKLISPED